MSAEIETLHKPFMSFLRSKGLKFINARSDRESTIAAGWPDFTVIHPQRGTLLVEMKDEGSLSPAQKKCHAELSAAGFHVHVIRKLQVAIETVYQWLSDVKPEAPRVAHSALFIALVPERGDFVMDKDGQPLRRATLEDFKKYQRKP